MNENQHGYGARDDESLALPPELSAIEANLALLRPRDERLERERIAFLAGQASAGCREARRSGWAWPLSFAGMTAIAASLFVTLLTRPEPQTRERIVYVHTAGPMTSRVGSPALRPATGGTGAQEATETPGSLITGGETDAAAESWLVSAWWPVAPPAVKPRVRSLERLLAETSRAPLKETASVSASESTGDVNQAIWSVRSASELLREAAASGEAATSQAPHTSLRSGANS